jgi:hypothetical protein
MKKNRFIPMSLIIIIQIAFMSGITYSQDAVEISTPMTPPEWALLERGVLDATAEAIERFYEHFFDGRGYLLHVPRWGALDGTDDAIEHFKLWTILHALGASDNVLALYKKGLEGHYLQYSEVTTSATDVARFGCYYKEFMPMSDWMHQGEGFQGLMHQGLSEPGNVKMQQRYRRFAGFYLNEDPDAINYDPEHRIIRSFWNGSRGPMLREGNTYDWGGDLTYGKYHLLHNLGGRSEMMNYEEEYPGIIHHFYFFPQSTAGDHPLNLATTQLALNAYMLDHEEKYYNWLVEYADAWKNRARENGGNFPSNIGLDGTIGGAVSDKWYHDKKAETGKWYMGTYGWNFSYYHWTKRINHENNIFWGIWPGMGNAYLATGDISYIEALRNQVDKLYRNKKTIDGMEMIPRHYGIHIDRDEPRKFDVFDIVDEKLTVPEGTGAEGWYNWTPNLMISELIDIYLWTMDKKDLERLPKTGWIGFLEGLNPEYPEESLRDQLEFIRTKMVDLRNDPTTPDTRLADWSLLYNPAETTKELVRLMIGGNLTGRIWTLHSRVRYFDPEKRRAGLPEDVASLVTNMEDGITRLTLVNINQIEPRTLVVQTGAYGEHQCEWVKVGEKKYSVEGRSFTVHLAAGSGAELIIKARRYANKPTLSFPW